MSSPEILVRDINAQFEEFIEWIVINIKTSTVTDPYSQAPLAETTSQLRLQVSWHDVATETLTADSMNGGVLGILASGNAFCIYQGNINLATYQLPKNSITRRGINYVIETVTNPSQNRWVLALRRIA